MYLPPESALIGNLFCDLTLVAQGHRDRQQHAPLVTGQQFRLSDLEKHRLQANIVHEDDGVLVTIIC